MALEAFGVFTGGIGLIQIGQELIPNDPPARGTTVSIKIGHPGKDGLDQSVEGHIGNVYSWHEDNLYQGRAFGSKIEMADFEEYTIDADVQGQSGYIGVSAETDAVCIAWIIAKSRDMVPEASGRWTGDIGKECGHQWHFNSEMAGTMANGTEHNPACTWLDADHSGGIQDASLKFSVQAYGIDMNKTFTDGKVCDYTAWAAESGPIADAPGKRSLKERSQNIKDTLIVSGIEAQTAEELCTSETSWGWDFIGSDGRYCDMDTHTLSPLCSQEEVDGCINLDEQNGAKRLTRRTFTKRSEGFLTATDKADKEYKHIAHW